ncbi:scarecrow-like protein 8 [Phragmites australis]|uniref:scarecrow-like protein 8 n=1 Tax=Phragmites australis TaxID=29695 RepID=UPI002D79FF27|nr:scarecrow-like protein 8 [Phragmites australis]
MEPGAPWRDPRQGYAYGLGSAIQLPLQQQQRSDAVAAGGVLKRSLGELERWQHQQQHQVAMQQELYLRAVRQRTAAAVAVSPLTSAHIAAVLGGTPTHSLVLPGSSFGGALASPSSTLSSLTTASRSAVPLMQPQLQRQVPLVTSSLQTQTLGVSRASVPSATSSELFILQELEKRLLGDDDEPVAAMSGTGSAVTNSEWEQTIQQLTSITAAPSPGLPATATPKNNTNAVMTGSPSNSSSSTASSSASCSPPTPGTASRQLLSEAAVAIADGNLETAVTHLAAIKRVANQHGDAEQRLIAMMVAALYSRIAPSASAQAQHVAEFCGAEQRAGSQLLHDISPCFRLALHAANVAIVEAVGDHRAVHLVDFDVSAPQHAALIQYLADRRVPGTSLKVTAVTDPTSPFTQSLTATLPTVGERLKKLAERAGIEYRFEVVSCRAAELDASKLGCEPGEALAVNLALALSHVPDESVSPANPRDELLRRVRALGPQVVTLVEQELNTNTAPLAARFSDACSHYGAILDSLDTTLGRESADRARAESALAKKAANAVGREGPDRLERCEVFGKWRARFGMAGFRLVALGAGIADQVVARVGPAPPGFTVKAENGVLRLGWMGRVVTVVSSWR